jgi:hypothetical protein
LGKTETIKARSIYVYLTSLEQKGRWADYAKQQGTSLSKFVIEHVENSLRQAEDAHYKSRGALWKDLRILKDQLDKVTREKRILEIAMERLEEELRRYRAQPFLDEEYVGIRRYHKDLIDLLRSGHVVSSDELLSRLRIDPTETELVKAIAKQLEHLEGYGLVVSSTKGWKWVE